MYQIACNVLLVNVFSSHFPGVPDDQLYSPLHVASESGHTAIIIALVEEGNANVNQKGGEKGDTPLMISVSSSPKSATFTWPSGNYQ